MCPVHHAILMISVPGRLRLQQKQKLQTSPPSLTKSLSALLIWCILNVLKLDGENRLKLGLRPTAVHIWKLSSYDQLFIFLLYMNSLVHSVLLPHCLA